MKSKYKDLTGLRFGRLTVVGLEETNTRKTYWLCRCDCGNFKKARSDSLQAGKIQSCGCLKKEQDAVNLSVGHKHLMSHTGIYDIWQGMKRRCYDIHNPRYHNYGGRGIFICDDWKNDFSAFYEWSVNNGYQENLTIDRIDNNKGYSPDNCRWADAKTQSRNRSSNVKITIGNATKTLTEWCEIFQLDYRTIHARYSRNGFISINDLFNANTEVTDRPSVP